MTSRGRTAMIQNDQRADKVFLYRRINMEKPISSGLKTLFLVHAIISLLFGLSLWLVPGRFLTLVGWVPQWVTGIAEGVATKVPGTMFMDAYIVRGLGAALLALAYASFRGWRATRWGEVGLLVELEIVFCLLGLLGMIATMFLVEKAMPTFGWVEIAILGGFGVAWLWAWRSHTRS
jgi:hypothetical protein